MASPPLPDSVLSRMSASHQAVRWKVVLGLTYQFSAYCCDIDSDGIMGVSKNPVPVLDIAPNPVCLGEAVEWDLGDSYAPGSAIVNYSIDMDDGTQYFVQSGNHTYGDVGTYTVVATVEEGLGKSQSIEIEVEVIDCDEALLMEFAYVSFDGGGVYFIDFTDEAPAWVDRNTGLSGDELNVNSMVLRPGDARLPNTVHELWIATDGGVFSSFDGGRHWLKMNMPEPSNDEFNDVPAATVDDLDFVCIRYSPKTAGTVYVLAASATPRLWIYKTVDWGITWENRGLST